MKKLLIVLAMCGLTMGAKAQETTTDPVLKYSVATNSFWSNWFIQVGADWNAYYLTRSTDRAFHTARSRVSALCLVSL